MEKLDFTAEYHIPNGKNPEKEIVELFKLPVMMWPPMKNMNEKQQTFVGAC